MSEMDTTASNDEDRESFDDEEHEPSGNRGLASEKDVGGFIDISSANRRVWLVKIPDFFAKRLSEIEATSGDQDVYVGCVKSTPHDASSKLMISLSPDGPMADLPLEYNLISFKPTQMMHLLVQSRETGEALGIQGKVEQECHMIPLIDNARYRALIRQRNEVANQPKRTVQLVQPDNRVGMVQHITEHALISRQQSRRVQTEERRERLPRAAVINTLFKAFERYERLTFADLEQYTMQPATYLKEILAEIAIYNKRGPHRNLYELRPDYARRKDK
jgi:transcription initiation factor TFIIF subunit beta